MSYGEKIFTINIFAFFVSLGIITMPIGEHANNLYIGMLTYWCISIVGFILVYFIEKRAKK